MIWLIVIGILVVALCTTKETIEPSILDVSSPVINNPTTEIQTDSYGAGPAAQVPVGVQVQTTAPVGTVISEEVIKDVEGPSISSDLASVYANAVNDLANGHKIHPEEPVLYQ